MTEPKGRAKGGKARAAAMTPEQRRESARNAAKRRWESVIPKATHTGDLHIGDMEIACAVLPDGSRVLSHRGVGRALGRARGGLSDTGDDAGEKLPFFAAAKSLKPFISNELMVALTEPVQYRHSAGGGVAFGLKASSLPEVCDLWLKARDAGALTRPQLAVAKRAETLIRGLAHIGIIALVDEATGYQEIRDKRALQAILDKYLLKEFAAWAKRFPDSFYKEMFRLRGWEFPTVSGGKPGVVGRYTMDIVYERLAPGLVKELEERNPKSESGRRKSAHHQWLTEDVGHPALSEHIHAVTGLMRAADGWDQFHRMLERAFPKKGEQLPLLADD